MSQQIMPWHTKPISDVLKELDASESGLSNDEAVKRLKRDGPNKLPEGNVDGIFIIFLRQFQSPLIYILVFAAIIVLIMGDTADAAIVFAVLLFNAVIGAIQEGKAQNILLALKNLAETSTTVLRDGKELIISDTEIVSGDIVLLQEGEKIPADARVISANALKADEASLTGESEPITKIPEKLPENTTIADQKNMVFKGTHIIRGSGTAIVVATGMETEIGKIAQKISTVDTEIPLKTNIRYLSKLIIIAVSLISGSLIIIGVLAGEPLIKMFTTAVALTISLIPESLPVVMTLVLATGVRRMSKRNILVKKMQAVEALGQTKIIAVDKTGTLTKNEMLIQRVFIGGKNFEITGSGYEPKGEVLIDGKVVDPLNHQDLLFSGRIASYCSAAHLSLLQVKNGSVDSQNDQNVWKVSGDPTEAAMLVLAEKIGFRHEAIEREAPKIYEIPFDYQKKYHATVRVVDNKNFLTAIGAPETILKLCKKFWTLKDSTSGETESISPEKLKELESEFHKLARNGFRVVAFAINQDVGQSVDAANLPHLTFVGFFGMSDALRLEVKESTAKVKGAGMKVIMITGDHRLTAQAIAKEAGIWSEGDNLLTGEMIESMSDGELAEKLENTTVFARVTPDHKLRIIQAYRKRGEVVAMTGDGVNDAPSLVAADLGVAMGKIGTEVAKGASDIILLDDNFSSIVFAAEEGRGIYKTIKKVILYLLAGSWSQVITIIASFFLRLPLPLMASQIIWLNFVTDGFLNAALAMDPKESGLLKGKFERPNKYIIDRLMVKRATLMSVPLAIGTLSLFSLYYEADIAKALTVSLTTLVAGRWFNMWSCRSESKSIFQMNPFTNPFLIGATIIIISLQLLAIYNPVMQELLHTTSLTFSEWAIIVPVAASVILIEEIRKFFYRRKII